MLNGSAADNYEEGGIQSFIDKKTSKIWDVIKKFFGMTCAMEEYVIWNLGCQGSLQGKFLEVSSKKINKIQQLIEIIQLKKLNHSKNTVIMQSLHFPFQTEKYCPPINHSQWLMREINRDIKLLKQEWRKQHRTKVLLKHPKQDKCIFTSLSQSWYKTHSRKHVYSKVTLNTTASFCSLSEGQSPTLPMIQWQWQQFNWWLWWHRMTPRITFLV